MPPNNYDPELPAANGRRSDSGLPDSGLKDDACPKCGAEMEPIEPGADGPPVERLQLCPKCYIVIWSDQDGLHVRQGIPMKKNGKSDGDISTWGSGEPREC
jgi:hypothetical protein